MKYLDTCSSLWNRRKKALHVDIPTQRNKIHVHIHSQPPTHTHTKHIGGEGVRGRKSEFKCGKTLTTGEFEWSINGCSLCYSSNSPIGIKKFIKKM